MRTLTSRELLSVWERGAALPVAGKALLLASACTDMSEEELSKMPIGRRDALLLGIRERMFGPHVDSVAKCAGCGIRLETGFDIKDIITEPPEEGEGSPSFNLDGFRITCRLPDTNDLLAISGCMDVAEGRKILLSRCLTGIRRNGEDIRADQLPTAVIEAVSERMAERDPQANVELAMVCPDCGHGWSAIFDIASYLWEELEETVYRILGEVHMLAGSYGWSESEILSMSAWRRQYYINMIYGS